MKKTDTELYFFLINSNLLSESSVGSRARRIIEELIKTNHEVVALSRDFKLPVAGLRRHHSYFVIALLFKALKGIRVYLYKNFSDRYYESLFLDYWSKLLVKFYFKSYSNIQVISFESTPTLFAYCSEMGLSTFSDVQILPISFALDLNKRNILTIEINKSLIKLSERENESLSLADNIISPSDFVTNYLIEGLNLPQKKIRNCNFGVDLERFRAIRKSIDSPLKSNINFGFLGVLTDRKGVTDLINVFSSFEFDEDTLLLGGSIQNNFLSLSEENSERDNIKFLGQVEPVSFFNSIDVLVLPSYVEGSAKVVYESMASGVIPVVTYNSGSIIEHEKEGYLFEAGNIKQLKDCMMKVKENFPENEMRKSMYEKIKFFSWDSYGKRYYEILKTVNKIEIKR